MKLIIFFISIYRKLSFTATNMSFNRQDTDAVLFLMRSFRSENTYRGIREIVKENNGYASLNSVVDPLINKIPEPEDKPAHKFDEVVLTLLLDACSSLMFVSRDLVEYRKVTVNPDGSASKEDYSILVSKESGDVLFYGKEDKYVSATSDKDSCLSKLPLRGFPVEWI